jgi:hypothetical protein
MTIRWAVFVLALYVAHLGVVWAEDAGAMSPRRPAAARGRQSERRSNEVVGGVMEFLHPS